MSGGIPEEMGKLVNLHTFSITSDSNGDTISGSLPESFALLANLETFNVNGSNIVGRLPRLSSKLTSCSYPANELSCHHEDNNACAASGSKGNYMTPLIL